jgi:hypothetical protein
LRVKHVATLTSLTDSAGVAFFADMEQVAKFESAIGDENRFTALEQVLGDDFPEITLGSDRQARFELARHGFSLRVNASASSVGVQVPGLDESQQPAGAGSTRSWHLLPWRSKHPSRKLVASRSSTPSLGCCSSSLLSARVRLGEPGAHC